MVAESVAYNIIGVALSAAGTLILAGILAKNIQEIANPKNK